MRELSHYTGRIQWACVSHGALAVGTNKLDSLRLHRLGEGLKTRMRTGDLEADVVQSSTRW